jgi:hypothetical protein
LLERARLLVAVLGPLEPISEAVQIAAEASDTELRRAVAAASTRNRHTGRGQLATTIDTIEVVAVVELVTERGRQRLVATTQVWRKMVVFHEGLLTDEAAS